MLFLSHSAFSLYRISAIFIIVFIGIGQCIALSSIDCPGGTFSNVDEGVFGDCELDVTLCENVTFNLDFSFNQGWTGSGNLEHEGEICPGEEGNTTCHDWLQVTFYVDGQVVGSDFVGSEGETRQSGTISLTYPLDCNSLASISWGTVVAAEDESVTINNVSIICNSQLPPISGTITADPSNAVCSGTSVRLTAQGSSPYLWSTGATSTSIVVNPQATSIYSVQFGSGCRTLYREITIPVLEAPHADAGEDIEICSGDEVTIKATGGNQFLWDQGLGGGQTKTVRPTSTTTYTVTVTIGECEDTDEITVSVEPYPIANAGIDRTICRGESVRLSASGGREYIWDQGIGEGRIHIVNPTKSTTYTVTVSNNKCTDTDEVTIQVNPLPDADAGEDITICAGDTATLNATGGTKYIWNEDLGEGAMKVVVPEKTSNFIVTVTENNCTATDEVTVNVNALPIVDAGEDKTICEGEITTLIATGGDSYLWDNDLGKGSQKRVQPSQSTVYTVTATTKGCSNTAKVKVDVNSIPIADAGEDVELCQGSSFVLMAKGGNNYQWNQNLGSGSVKVVQPQKTTLYSVTVANGECESTDDILVSVSTPPIAEILSTIDRSPICAGDTVILTASPASQYRWSSGSNDQKITVAPLSSETWQLVVYDENDCSDTTSVFLEVSSLPLLDLGPDIHICENDSVNLFVDDHISVLWSTGSMENSLVVKPVSDTILWIESSQLECRVRDSLYITLDTIPTVQILGPAEVCELETFSLWVENDYQNIWNQAFEGKVFEISLNSSEYINLMTTNGTCITEDSVLVAVNEMPEIEIQVESSQVCDDLITLRVDSIYRQYIWNTGEQVDSIVVHSSGIYEVQVFDKNGCTDRENIEVAIYKTPIPLISEDIKVCNTANSYFNFPTELQLDTLVQNDVAGFWFQTPESSEIAVETINFAESLPGIYRIFFSTTGATLPCLDTIYEVEVNVVECNCKIAEFEPLPLICNDQSVVDLNDIVNNNVAGNWQFEGGPQPLAISNGIVDFSSSQPGPYNLVYLLDHEEIVEGCPSQQVYSLEVIPKVSPDLLVDSVVCKSDELFIEFDSDYEGLYNLSVVVGSEIMNFNRVEPGFSFNFPIEMDVKVSLSNISFEDANCGYNLPPEQEVKISQLSTSIILESNYNGYSVSCADASDGIVSVFVSEGNGPFSYEWQDGNTESLRTNLQAGHFELTVSDRYGCTNIDTITLLSPEKILTYSNPIDVLCAGMNSGQIKIDSIVGMSASYGWILNNETHHLSEGTSFVIDSLAAGIYHLTIYDQWGCISEKDTIEIDENLPIFIELVVPDNVSFHEGVQIETNLNFVPDSIRWEPDDGLSCLNCLEPFASPSISTLYKVIAIDENGCQAQDEVWVNVDNMYNLFIPPAFSPNADQINDLWVIHGDQSVDIIEQVLIYDRLGNLVFQNNLFDVNQQNRGWDGNFQDKALPADSYAYILDVRFIDGTSRKYVGEVQIIR